MSYIVFSLLAAVLGFVSPVYGLVVFLVANTGAVGFFERVGVLGTQLGPFRPGNIGYISAVVALALRRSGDAERRRGPSAMGILLWVVTGTILFSRAVEVDSLTVIAKTAVYCLLWAPLFSGLQKLTPSERLWLERIIVALSALTALLTVLVVVTGTEDLYQILSVDRLDDVPAPREWTIARVTLPGLWTFAPLGFWLSLRMWRAQPKWLSWGSLVYGASIAIILVALWLNLSRSVLFGIATGLLLFLLLSFLTPRLKTARIWLLLVLLSVVTVYAASHLEGLQTAAIRRFGEGLNAYSWYQRVSTSRYYWRVLSYEGRLLGRKDDRRYALDNPIGGDPYTLLRVWWDYGLIAALSLAVVLLVITPFYLARALMRGRYGPERLLVTIASLTAYYVQLHWMMLSGLYLFPDALFALTFFLSEVAQVAQAESQWNSSAAQMDREQTLGLNCEAGKRLPSQRESRT
jgi:hypothetical protein